MSAGGTLLKCLNALKLLNLNSDIIFMKLHFAPLEGIDAVIFIIEIIFSKLLRDI